MSSYPHHNLTHPEILLTGLKSTALLTKIGNQTYFINYIFSSSSGSHISAVSECLGAWLNYLQVLNNLCGSGYKLAKSINHLFSILSKL